MNKLWPTEWPQLWRRIFLLTLPVSVPLYIASIFLMGAVFIVCVAGLFIIWIVMMITIKPCEWAYILWTGDDPWWSPLYDGA